jgi:hypothetical protein
MQSLAYTFSNMSYHTFGMLMPGRKYATATYRFGFNKQERDNEVYGVGNLNTALFWEYDTRLGRRWNVDPVFIPAVSPFTCLLNNPVSYYDILGNVVDGDANGKEKYNNLKAENNSKIENLEKQISTTDASNTKQLTLLNKQLNMHKDFACELEALEKSKVVYWISSEKSEVAIADLHYDADNNRMQISLGNCGSDKLAHELQHGYDFETGQYAFSRDGSANGSYSIKEEIRAYEIGYLFSNKNAIDVSLSGGVTEEHVRARSPVYSNLPSNDYNLDSKAANMINVTNDRYILFHKDLTLGQIFKLANDAFIKAKQPIPYITKDAIIETQK